jgi:3-dehydroquinate dehydratase-2
MNNNDCPAKRIAVINGPNLNMTGVREVQYYGRTAMDEILDKLQKDGCSLQVFQSNHEGVLVDYIQSCYQTVDGIIINPAAFTINGYSILEALLTVEIPFIEVHMSNIFARGGWHSKSIFSPKSIGMLCGFKENTYQLALDALYGYLTWNNKNII